MRKLTMCAIVMLLSACTTASLPATLTPTEPPSSTSTPTETEAVTNTPTVTPSPLRHRLPLTEGYTIGLHWMDTDTLRVEALHTDENLIVESLIIEFDPVTGQRQREHTSTHPFYFSLLYAPQPPWMAKMISDQEVALLNATTLEEIHRLPLTGDQPIRVLSWSVDGELLAVQIGHEITLFEAVTAQEVLRLEKPFPNDYAGYGSLTWSPDGESIAAGVAGQDTSDDGIRPISKVVVWSLSGGDIIHEVDYTSGAVISTLEGGQWQLEPGTQILDPMVAWSPDNTRLLLGGGGLLEALDAENYERKLILQRDEDHSLRHIVWSPDGEAVSLVWDQPSQEQGLLTVLSLGAAGEAVVMGEWAIMPGPAGQEPLWAGERVALAVGGGEVLVVDGVTGEATRFETDGLVQTLAWSPDGQWLAASLLTNEVIVWPIFK